jgi:hypothetical protein
MNSRLSSVAEHRSCKPGAAGSNPAVGCVFASSRFKRCPFFSPRFSPRAVVCTGRLPPTRVLHSISRPPFSFSSFAQLHSVTFQWEMNLIFTFLARYRLIWHGCCSSDANCNVGVRAGMPGDGARTRWWPASSFIHCGTSIRRSRPEIALLSRKKNLVLLPATAGIRSYHNHSPSHTLPCATLRYPTHPATRITE